MRKRLIVLTAVLALLAFGVVGGAFAYDHSTRDRIAAGVRVNGVAIGGMTRAQAEARLHATLLKPLDRPVRATYHGHTFTLTPRQASIGIDIHGTVDKALARSQQGNMFSRSWRNLRNASLNAQLAADVSWSQPAIQRLVRRAQKAIDRPARDAQVDLSKGKVEPTKSRIGVRVKFNTLAKQLQRTLLDPGSPKDVKIATTVVQPKVSTAQLAKRYPAVIIINRGAFKLTFYKHLKPVKTYGIAVGQVGLETPAGLYQVQNKAVDPAWHVPNSAWAGSLAGQVIPGGAPNNPIKSRWMGIFDGAGIHGTSDDSSIGSAASHGCIRMHIPDVVELYDQVPVGAPVYIA
jgi:lipoprotein-anchoring transpeptidase ErfK/SrfK